MLLEQQQNLTSDMKRVVEDANDEEDTEYPLYINNDKSSSHGEHIIIFS